MKPVRGTYHHIGLVLVVIILTASLPAGGSTLMDSDSDRSASVCVDLPLGVDLLCDDDDRDNHEDGGDEDEREETEDGDRDNHEDGDDENAREGTPRRSTSTTTTTPTPTQTETTTPELTRSISWPESPGTEKQTSVSENSGPVRDRPSPPTPDPTPTKAESTPTQTPTPELTTETSRPSVTETTGRTETLTTTATVQTGRDSGVRTSTPTVTDEATRTPTERTITVTRTRVRDTTTETESVDSSAPTLNETQPNPGPPQTDTTRNKADTDPTTTNASSSSGDENGGLPFGLPQIVGLGIAGTAVVGRYCSPVGVGSGQLHNRLSERIGRIFGIVIGSVQRDDDDDDWIYENEYRGQIYERLENQPGQTTSELADELDIARSTVRYHIGALFSNGKLTDVTGYGNSRYWFSAESLSETEHALMAALRNESSAKIITTIYGSDRTMTGADLAETTDRTPAAVSNQLNQLDTDGLIARESVGQEKRTILTERARTLMEQEAIRQFYR